MNSKEEWVKYTKTCDIATKSFIKKCFPAMSYMIVHCINLVRIYNSEHGMW